MEEIFSRYDIKNLRAVILLGQEAWATFLARKKFDMETPFFGCFASTNGIIVPRTSPGTDWYPESVDMIHLADSIGVAGGSLNRYDVRKNIELILSLYPNTENIALVSEITYGQKVRCADRYVEGRQRRAISAVQLDGQPYFVQSFGAGIFAFGFRARQCGNRRICA